MERSNRRTSKRNLKMEYNKRRPQQSYNPFKMIEFSELYSSLKSPQSEKEGHSNIDITPNDKSAF